ncbi:MAG TPA: hypothetical protein VHB20_04430 [Verrucomicrobiae bacterium]|jgi:sugar lactone lactonase YvrE|nr:hypothetical protein [Verrucomicrobiae bacterium]
MKPIVHYFSARIGLAVLGLAALGASSVQGQFVSTAITNLHSPNGLAVDGSGNVYITESGSNRVIKYIPSSGVLSTLAGFPSSTGATNNGTGTAAHFNNPAGIAYVPARGGLVVADSGNNDLRLVTLNGVVTTIAGTPGVYGPAAAGSVPAASAFFSFPEGIAADPNGNIYIADTGNSKIRLLDTNNLVWTIQITNGYSFYNLQGLELDPSGNLWIADTKNDTICVISNIASGITHSATLIAGAVQIDDVTDDDNALNARFSLPSGVFWDAQTGSLLVADTGNETIRNLYSTNGSWAVQTLAGTPGAPGHTDGAPNVALFSQPVQIVPDVYDSGLYVVDRANGSIRDFQPSPPQPQVADPTFGYVTFGKDGSQFADAVNGVFNNFDPPRIAIKAEAGTQTYLTFGPTPDPFHNTIPVPGPSTGLTPDTYHGDSLSASESALSIVQPQPDITLFAVSQATGRKPSSVVSARYQFVVGNPVITGDNPAAIQLTDVTASALLFYTLDGSLPTDDGSNTNSVGPIGNGQTISLNIVTNVTLTVRGFRTGFAPSGPSTENLSVTNFQANNISFGFAFGEASSSFIAAAGQKFYAPITLSLLPNATMYSLQFNVTVTNLAGSPAPGPTYNFESMLEKPDPNNSGVFDIIPPLMFGGVVFATNYVTNVITTNLDQVITAQPGFTNGVFADTSINLLGVGWLERAGSTNLYNTKSQDLITFSQAKDIQHSSADGKVIVGGYSFVVPTTATAGQQYKIQIGRPSATADGIGVVPALLVAPTNGSMTNGPINSIKTVVVGSAKYIVGDVNNFRWFNAGDFGDGNLDNSDVMEVFQSAVYKLNSPPIGSDMRDAMDSSNGGANADPQIFNGTGAAANAIINGMQYGDGQLDISDVYVTFRRSLDPTLTWYTRSWIGGSLVAQATSNAPVKTSITPGKTGVAVAHTLTVAAGQVIASGSSATIPLQVVAPDPNGMPVRTLMFDVVAEPLDGSPAITAPITFTPNPGLGAPTLTLTQSADDFSAAWLDASSVGVSGAGVLGYINLTLPAGAGANAAYRVSIKNFSASPNGLGVFAATVQNGLVTASARTASSWGDGIPDVWRLQHFGTIADPTSYPTFDADGDGQSNWQEYVAGTDPLDATSVFKLQSAAGSAFALQWPSVSGKHYIVQSSSSPDAANWTNVSTNAGTGGMIKWTDSNPAPQARFFRAIVQ